jgi:flagellar motor switch protein FliM
MASQGKNSILHRKALGGRLDFDARVMTPSKALRLALAKSADKLFELVLTVTLVEQITLTQGKIRDVAGNDGLLIVLDGAYGTCGAAKFDMQMLAGLIEVQTMGFVQTSEAKPRPVTATDAAMVAPMMDAVMQGYDAELSEAMPGYQPQGFRFGDRVEDGRALSLILDAPEYDLFRLSVDLGEGAKTGVLTLILPVQPQMEHTKEAPGAQAGARHGFKGNALDAPVTMDAVVARIRMPLNEVCQLAIGSVLPVPAESFSNTELVAAGNHVVAKVLLGQMSGLKAVRFAATEGGPQSQGAEPERRGTLADDIAGRGGETLEGLAVDLGHTGHKAAAVVGDPSVPEAERVVESPMPMAAPAPVDLSELDALPEEV